MRWLRQEFRGLRPTPLAEDLKLIAAAVALLPFGYCFLLFLLWCGL